MSILQRRFVGRLWWCSYGSILWKSSGDSITALWILWFLPSIYSGNYALFFVYPFAVQIIFANSSSLVQTNFSQRP